MMAVKSSVSFWWMSSERFLRCVTIADGICGNSSFVYWSITLVEVVEVLKEGKILPWVNFQVGMRKRRKLGWNVRYFRGKICIYSCCRFKVYTFIKKILGISHKCYYKVKINYSKAKYAFKKCLPTTEKGKNIVIRKEWKKHLTIWHLTTICKTKGER